MSATPSIGERLQILLDYVYPAGAEPYSQSRVAALASTPDNLITTQQVNGILTGRTKSPSFRTISGLAEFFKVPLDYFSTTDFETWSEYEWWIKRMRERADSAEGAALHAPRYNRWRQIRDQKKKSQPRKRK